MGVALLPLKTNAPLIVNADTPLTCSGTTGFFQPIGGWNSQIIDGEGIVNHAQFPQGDLLNIKWQLAGRLALKNLLSEVVFEGFYHGFIL